ncbi:hypothetical protein K439DRAFT_1628456, partial [Ramaria rubella]
MSLTPISPEREDNPPSPAVSEFSSSTRPNRFPGAPAYSPSSMCPETDEVAFLRFEAF